MPWSNFRKLPNYLIIGFPFAVLLGWFYLKVYQFQYLNENFVDGLIALQLSRGWLEGRPVLFDTYYGSHWLHHNYYFILLTGFVTKFTGLYGLFLIYLGLLGTFLAKFYCSIRSRVWYNDWFIILLFSVGPIAYHVYLDNYGWHPEQYFLPLLGLFALSLARRKWVEVVIWGLLILSIKETAIVLLCGLLLFASVLSSFIKNPNERWERLVFNRNNYLIIGSSLLIFGLGMWWLSYLNGPHPSRLGQAILLIQKKGSFLLTIAYTGLVAFFSSVTLVAAYLFFVPWWRVLPNPRAIIVVFVGFCFVLLAVFYIEGLLYFPEPNMSIRYPARVGSLWAYMMSCYVLMCIRLTEANFQPHYNQREWLLWAGLFQYFITPMAVSNASSIHGQMFSIKKNLLFVQHNRAGIKPYVKSPAKALYDLAQRLPKGCEIVCPAEYVNVFQNVYANEWSFDLRILTRPYLYIYEKKDLNTNKKYIFPKKEGYITVPHPQFLILADSVWYNQHFK